MPAGMVFGFDGLPAKSRPVALPADSFSDKGR